MAKEGKILCVLILLCIELTVFSASSDRIKLTDLKIITLYSGKMTNGRRTYPIPQLKCVGGTAGCSAFIPKVVQCSNQGSDGYDIQWECKTDMDNAYRFGNIEVICEGYDYPDDPYVLKGSCGLEYTIDFTKGGYQQKHSNNYGYSYRNEQSYSKFGKTSVLGDIIVLIIICIIIYAIIKTCLYRNEYSTTSDDRFPPSNDSYFSGGFNSPGFGSSPPPPGFRADYSSDFGPGCGTPPRTSGTGTGGGFWTGAMTGGLLGYMFGSRGSRTGSSWYSSRPSHFHESTNFSSGSSGSPSSETRTASGFGGTRRR